MSLSARQMDASMEFRCTTSGKEDLAEDEDQKGETGCQSARPSLELQFLVSQLPWLKLKKLPRCSRREVTSSENFLPF